MTPPQGQPHPMTGPMGYKAGTLVSIQNISEGPPWLQIPLTLSEDSGMPVSQLHVAFCQVLPPALLLVLSQRALPNKLSDNKFLSTACFPKNLTKMSPKWSSSDCSQHGSQCDPVKTQVLCQTSSKGFHFTQLRTACPMS